MKFLLIFIVAMFAGSLAQSQLIYSYKDKGYIFKVSVDSSLSGDKRNYDYSVKSISIYKNQGNTLLQTIIPPENFTLKDSPQETLLLNDINFDGYTDLMIVQFVPAAPNIPYFYWKFDKESGQFLRDTTLEKITSPNFEKKEKLITSFWRASFDRHGTSTYKYINGKVVLVKEVEIWDDEVVPNQQIMSVKKLVKGKMKTVKRTVEKIEN